MTERDARLADFGSWHTSLNGQRIALYGSGAAAEDVARAYADELDLVCVVDDSRAGETAFGLEVTTLKEALTRGVETIVIATKAPNIEPIYQRICGMCQATGVRLLDLYGNDLHALHARLGSQDASREGLLEAVGRADVVCVDSMVLAGRFGSTLAEELEGGSRMARSCKAAIGLATAQGKQLVIVCDGENTAKASAEVLCEWDMQAPVTYISSEDLGCHKENGLFRRVKEGFLGKRILHVGCDRVRDGIYALVFGLDAYLLSNAASEAVAFVPLPSPNSPEAPTSSVSLSFALGEAVFGYLAWLSARLGEDAFDGVLFPARDGDVLIRAYDILRSSHPELDLPPAFYPLLSRKAVAAAFLDRPEAQRWIAASSTAKTLSAMVGLDLEPADDTYESRLLCLCEARPKLEELATTTREGILGHLRSLGLREGGRYAFCEFVSAGTCQQLLERIVPFELHGFYFGTHGFGLESQSIECFFSSEHEAFMACHVESETLVSSVEPPLAGFLRDGTPRFDHDDRTPDELAEIGRTHAEILDLLRSLLGSPGHGLCAISPDVVNLAFAKAVGPRVAMTMTDSWRQAPNEGAEAPLASSIQDVLYGLLEAFDATCERHGLTWCAANGTLLGAVRHQGIIPWDTDLDVFMPREDFDRLCLLPQSEWEEPFFLQTAQNDPECFYGGYARLRNSSTSALEWQNAGHTCNQGIWMDILPLDYVDDDERQVSRQFDTVGIWQRILYAKTYPNRWELIDEAHPRVRSAYFLAANHASREWLLARLHHACTSHRPSNKLALLACHYRWGRSKERFFASELADLERVPFGRSTIVVPRSAERWLCARYGTEWSRAQSGPSPHDTITYDPTTPYDELIARKARR